jgi:tetratricopeptide (TPR) repeat protein
MHVTNSLLQCISDFAALMLDKRQKRPPSFMPGREETTNQQPSEDINRLQTRWYINATAEVFENAHYFLKLGEPSKAIERLNDAVATAPRMLTNPDLFLLIRLIEIATWSSWKRFPEYERAVFPFLATLARNTLGQQHPLTLLLDCFSKAAAISKSYPILWICVIDHIDQMADEQLARGEAQELRIKAYFYLVRVLRNNKDHFAAVQRCQELIHICIATDGFRSFSANRARYNLAVNYCEAGNVKAAMEAYDETRKYLGTADCPYEGWVFAVFATNELAQLYEQEGNLDKAGKYYEEALVSFLRREGDESSGALLMLKDLVDFHKRFSHEEQLARIQIQYHAMDALISAGRLDDVRLWVGCRVTTQASGGKKNRAWTWTSPIA